MRLLGIELITQKNVTTEQNDSDETWGGGEYMCPLSNPVSLMTYEGEEVKQHFPARPLKAGRSSESQHQGWEQNSKLFSLA